jgi:hypothetical protein
VMGGGRGGAGYGSKAVEKMLRDYLPPRMLSGGKADKQNTMVPDLPSIVAMGVVESFERGDFDDSHVWASISRWYPRIRATALGGRIP